MCELIWASFRATQHYEQFQELSSLLSEEDEKLDAMDENLDKISERMEGAESKVQELAREVEMIGDEQRIDALADQCESSPPIVHLPCPG